MDLDTMISEDSYSNYMLKKADAYRIPILGTFELTSICNMKCDMCYIQQDCEKVESKGGLKDVSFWNRVIDQAVEEGMLFCLLTGGEIFTYPGFEQLYEKLCKKGVSIVLNTNGTLLNEENVAWLAQFPPRRLNVSLYGASNDTYQKMCHLKNGFDKVISGLDLLKKYNIPFRIHGVMIPENLHDYEGIKEVCNYYDAKLQLSYYMFPPVRKELGNRNAKTRFETKQMAEFALMYRKEQCLTDEGWRSFVEDKCNKIEHPEQEEVYGVTGVTCRAGCSSFWVNWKGEISGCGVDDTHFYSLEDYSFKEAWELVKGETDKIVLSETCATCPYRCICPTCMAAAYCETGRLDGTPEYLCEFSKIYAEMLFAERDRLREEKETE